MTPEATQLLAEMLRVVKLDATFSPLDVGARIGLTRTQAETAARVLANSGVLDVGFDFYAQFTPEFRKAHAPRKTRASAAKTSEKTAAAKVAPDKSASAAPARKKASRKKTSVA